MAAQPVMVPDSVIRLLVDTMKAGERLSERQRDRIYRFAIELRNGSPAALQLAERFDRGEIGEDQLFEIDQPTQWRVPDSVLRVIDAHLYELEGWRTRLQGDFVGEIDRVLYESSKRNLFAFLMKIHNGSPAAIRACEQFDRGEIDGNQLLEMA